MGALKDVSRTVAGLPVLRHLIDIQTDVAVLKKSLTRAMVDDYLKTHLFDNPKYADPKKLNRYEFQAYSQNGEDGIIQEIFKRIGATNKFFVEFGVGNGMECNSFYLLMQDWKGLWIEPNQRDLPHLKKQHGKALSEKRLTLLEEFVTSKNIEQLFAAASVPTELDLLSIDTDGNDYWLWKALEKFKPRVVVMEYNALHRPPVKWVMKENPNHGWKADSLYGASLASYTELGRQKGYVLVGCTFTGINAFFVREDLAKDLFAAPYTAENHYEPLRLHIVRDASVYDVNLGEYERI